MKLYQVVEIVSTEKLIDFEVKGHLQVKFLKFLIQLIWNLNIYILRHWIGKPTILEAKSGRRLGILRRAKSFLGTSELLTT